MAGRLPRGVRAWLRVRPDASEHDAQNDLDDELRLHVELRAAELQRRGLDPESARREALRRLDPDGSGRRQLVRRARWTARRRRIATGLREVLADFSHARRQLVRSPGVTLLAFTALTLVLGANAAVFGLADRLLFRPPAHIVDSDGVRRVFATLRPRSSDSLVTSTFSFPDYRALREAVPDPAVQATSRRTLSWGRGPEARPVVGALVTGGYFEMLGVRPLIGRVFTDSDVGASIRPAVLSHRFWNVHLGAESGALGRDLRLGDGLYRVVGVAPPGFAGVELEAPDIWIPMEDAAAETLGPDWRDAWGSKWLQVIVRTGPGASRSSMEGRLSVALQRTGQPDREDATIALWPGVAGRGPHGGVEGRVALWTAGVGLAALLAAAANLANLLLARGFRRRRDTALRLALGASRGRIARELMAEVLLLTALAGTAGLALAHAVLRVSASLIPQVGGTEGLLDLRVAAFTVAAVVATALTAGLLPALQTMRGQLVDWLRGTGASWDRGRPMVRHGLIGTQFAVCTVLLIGALVFVRSLHNVLKQDFGFDRDNVSMVFLRFSSETTNAAKVAIYERALERVLELPGVEGAALSTSVPFAMSTSIKPHVPGTDELPQLRYGIEMAGVGPGFFGTMGMVVVRGRHLEPRDAGSIPGGVVVNRTMERILWGDGGALGRCLHLWSAEDPCVPVVGVVEDMRTHTVGYETAMQYFVPFGSEHLGTRVPALLVRSNDPGGITGALRTAVQSVAPDMPYATIRPLSEIIEPQLRSWRLGAAAFTALTVVVVLLVVVGLYGVIAFEVRQRRAELGIRLALGARPMWLLGAVVRRAVIVAAIGMSLGVLVVAAAHERLSPLLFEVSPLELTTLIPVAGGMLLLALLASGGPALEAGRTDPARTLRDV